MSNVPIQGFGTGGTIPGANSISLGGSSDLGGLLDSINTAGAQFGDLLALQQRMQTQNQVFSTMSNVSKVEHDTRMASVRNIRA